MQPHLSAALLYKPGSVILFPSITTNNDDVKDCKIRKSLLASQYYLFWPSFCTETAKTSFVKKKKKKKKKCWTSKSIDLE